MKPKGKSFELFNRSKKVIPGGVNSPVRFFEPYPFFVSSSLGSKIVTVEHNILLDYCMAYGSILLGHSYHSIIEKVINQISNGTLYCIPSEKEVLLCERLCNLVPCAEKTRLVNTGSEATMTAIRLSRAFTGKNKIVKLDGGYHGSYDYVLVKAGSGAANVPSSSGSLKEISRNTLIAQYNDIHSLETLVKQESENISCIIMEPVYANMGLILPEKNYLNDVKKLAEQNNIILIFDEVVTGFRLALGGASEFFGIKPDLVTFSKSLGNGFPIAAICGRDELMNQLSPNGSVYQASTYAGNPISVTAALANLQTLIDEGKSIYPKISTYCDSLVNGIKDNFQNLNHFSINHIGSMFQIFFTNSKVINIKGIKKSNIELFRKLFFELLKRDIFIPPSQYETCFISYSHSEDDLDKTIESYSESIKKIYS
ncbi:MAG: aspartate aminotransferase family protein [Nitrososphaeraceae archaeon]